MVTATQRRIERVPSLLTYFLSQSGNMPTPPAAVMALWKRENQRLPTIEELGTLSWVVEWKDSTFDEEGALTKPLGVVGYRDAFDLHTNSDVRDVVHLAGTARSCVAIVRHVCREAKLNGRRCIASIDFENHPLARLLSAMGYTPKRVMFEDLT